MTDGPLAGIRVVDVSVMMAGPMCGARLGDLGADVIKIEPPEKGEFIRSYGIADASIEGETTSFLGFNRNKRSVTLDLKHPEGLGVLLDLVKASDVFVQNYRVGTADRLGFGYPTLHALNPRLVYCTVSGYGDSGPYAKRPGQDLVIQGYAGAMWNTGRRGDPPTPNGVFVADAAGAAQATIGVLAALLARERTGTGQKVEVSLLGSLMDAQLQELTAFLNTGIEPERPNEPTAQAMTPAPYGAYETADSWITIALPPLDVLGDVLDNDRLRGMTPWSDGLRFPDEIGAVVREALKTRTTAEWMEIFDRSNIWVGPVNTYGDLEHDPHVVETEMITEVDHPTAGRVRMPNVPQRFSDTPASVRSAGPRLGADTDDVLTEVLGRSSDEVAALRDAGAIGREFARAPIDG